jgi:hypothetical protein
MLAILTDHQGIAASSELVQVIYNIMVLTRPDSSHSGTWDGVAISPQIERLLWQVISFYHVLVVLA